MRLADAVMTLVILVAIPWSASAQDAAGAPLPSEASVTVSGIISVQTSGDVLESGSSYLNKGLGGVVPGIAIAFGAAHSRAVFDVEFSTTTTISSRQQYVGGAYSFRASTPFESKHTDTLLSFLAGVRTRHKRGWVDYKAGGSRIFGRPTVEGEDFEDRDIAGKFALTIGVDWVLRPKSSLQIVTGAKHSYAFRGRSNDEVFLGANILRVGVGVRWGLK